jgi:hypothetical protein
MERGVFARAAVAALCALLAGVEPAAGQEADEAPPSLAALPVPRVSPVLPPGHWAARAAERAEAMGLAPGYLPPQRTATRAAVAAALAEARVAGRGASPEVRALTEGWLARFVEEFSEYVPREEERRGALRFLGGSFALGGEQLRGRLEPGTGLFDLRTDPVPIPDHARATFASAAGVELGEVLVIHAEVREGGEERVPRGELTARAGAFTAAYARRQVGYGSGRGGGVVIGGAATLTGVEVQTPRPLRLPGVLRHLGAVTGHTFVSRLREDRHVGDPWFWSAHVGLRPHPRLTVGINRAAVFGGDSVAPVTARRLAGMFAGLLSEDFENQAVSLDLRYRLPTEALLPVSVYLEWGSEDAAGAWWNVPGIVAGAHMPALPGVPDAGVGVEHTWFSGFGRKNPPWYLHSVHRGGWSADRVPLGHPLGGEGRETLVYGDLDAVQARLRLEGRAFLRHRSSAGYETFLQAGNIFAPTRVGNSRGGALRADVRVMERLDLRLHGFLDRGRGWTERVLRAEAAIFY